MTARAVVLVAAMSLSCGARAPRHEEFAIGMTRADVTARFGEPERTEALTKSDESIWGPVESFWSEVPMGSDIEIWAFRSSRNGRPGQTELYFVDHADAVGGIGFYDEGAVYESRP